MKRIIFISALTTALYSGKVVWNGNTKPNIFKNPYEDNGCFKRKLEDNNSATCKNI